MSRKGKADDIGWQHGTQIDKERQKSQCRYCSKIIGGGGVTRLKQHLAGGFSNVSQCPLCPKEVRVQMNRVLRHGLEEKNKRDKINLEFRESVMDRPNRRNETVDLDSDDEDYETHQFREAVRRSLNDSRSDDSRRSFHQSTYDAGGGSNVNTGLLSRQRGFSRTQSVREPSGYTPRDELPIDPHSVQPQGGRQKRIKEAFGFGNIRKTMGKAISKFIHFNGIPPHVANNVYYDNMVNEIARAGPGVKPPTAYELRGPFLDDEVAELNEYIEGLKKNYKMYGVTIMCDGWTGPTRLSIVNFMIYCDGKSIFHKSIDTSKDRKDADYIFNLMKEVVESIGEQHVVQIVTDNGPNYVKAGKRLMRRYNLFWTPCAAHSIDLILKDIGQTKTVQKVVHRARQITKFIYNHSIILSLMREKCGGDIIRPGLTRFATNYIALESLQQKKNSLKEMVASPQWRSFDVTNSSEAKAVEGLINKHTFWTSVHNVVNILEPIAKVLRMVDGDKKPTMGYIYHAMELMKNQVEKAARSPRVYLNIIDERWTRHLTHPLHRAAYYFNPKYQYEHGLGIRGDLLSAVEEVVAKLVLPEEQANCLLELKPFREASGSFGKTSARNGRNITQPAEWWLLYGNDAPNLRSVAIKVLAQTASSSGCERNWSTFGLIHSQRRNRLGHERLHKHVFVHYNMRLRLKHQKEDYLDSGLIDLADIFCEDGEEDPLFEWVREVGEPDMDEPNNRPNSQIASELGLNDDTYVSTSHTENVNRFMNTSSSSTNSPSNSPGDSDNGDDGNNNMNNESNDVEEDNNERNEGNAPYTEEHNFDHATQDYDHGVPQRPTEPVSYSRRRKKQLAEMNDSGTSSWGNSVDNVTNTLSSIGIDNSSYGYGSSSASFGYNYPSHVSWSNSEDERPSMFLPQQLSLYTMNIP